jgi:hypothetical protein
MIPDGTQRKKIEDARELHCPFALPGRPDVLLRNKSTSFIGQSEITVFRNTLKDQRCWITYNMKYGKLAFIAFLGGLFCVQLFLSQKQQAHIVKVSNQFYSTQIVHKTVHTSVGEYSKPVEIPPAPPQLLTDPFWSIILTGRNDNYGETYIKRLNNFVKNIGYLISKYSLSAELIITEWNPVEGSPTLADIVDWFYSNCIEAYNIIGQTFQL